MQLKFKNTLLPLTKFYFKSCTILMQFKIDLQFLTKCTNKNLPLCTLWIDLCTRLGNQQTCPDRVIMQLSPLEYRNIYRGQFTISDNCVAPHPSTMCRRDAATPLYTTTGPRGSGDVHACGHHSLMLPPPHPSLPSFPWHSVSVMLDTTYLWEIHWRFRWTWLRDNQLRILDELWSVWAGYFNIETTIKVVH